MDTFQKFIEIYESRIKLRILNYLQVYQELSLTELSDKIGKSKSTISKHLKEMQNIIIGEKSFITMRQQKYRGSIKQKLFSIGNNPLFFGKTYSDIKNYTPEELYQYLHVNEHLINFRFFSLLKDINLQTIDYINEFYQKLNVKELDENFKENIYKYNTCIPRIEYFTKEEYYEYRKKFMEFDERFLAEIEQKRKENPQSSTIPREYMVYHALLPIKRILDKKYAENFETKL